MKSSKMMRRVRCLSLALCLLLPCLLVSCGSPKGPIEYTEIGAPQAERYTENMNARCPWDMIVYDGSLYVGGGDYDANAGPADIWRYDAKTGEWSLDGTVPDEEVSRFYVMNDGTLSAPGIDPRDDWTFGNYYVQGTDGWETVRTIPNAKHVFDIAEHGGAIYAGLGAEAGRSAIARSTDGGQTFEPIGLYKDGQEVDTADMKWNRVYDLFTLGDGLYAALFLYDGEAVTYDLYRLEGDAFVFDNQWYGKVSQVRYIGNIVGGKAQHRDRLYFTTGYLYVTTDMSDCKKIVFGEGEVVYDLCVVDDVLYALSAVEQEDGTYRVSVRRNRGGEVDEFTECFYFSYEIPPLSLAAGEDQFYIGMGTILGGSSEKNGTILCVEYEP